jgi:hypothetical protein
MSGPESVRRGAGIELFDVVEEVASGGLDRLAPVVDCCGGEEALSLCAGLES